ncbi:hypothetical protein CLV58_113134 [Spirosoma oryzae]|uniref:Uncharacterized protein n=1 Tax=Spirosoma oryzae TaxID=1469603 RepID=A0A2T0SRK1_9BACT|nr:hypothetical protein CLV58_113134 [Spirosoma oryzae]
MTISKSLIFSRPTPTVDMDRTDKVHLLLGDRVAKRKMLLVLLDYSITVLPLAPCWAMAKFSTTPNTPASIRRYWMYTIGASRYTCFR